MRHWKQRFNPKADFVWNRPIVIEGRQFLKGDPIPKEILAKINQHRLRRWWEARAIALAPVQAAAPAPAAEAPPRKARLKKTEG